MTRIQLIAAALTMSLAALFVPENVVCCTVGPGANSRIEFGSPIGDAVRPEGALVVPVHGHGADVDRFRNGATVAVYGPGGSVLEGEVRVEPIWTSYPNPYMNHNDNEDERWLMVWRAADALSEGTHELTVELDREDFRDPYTAVPEEASFSFEVSSGVEEEPPTLENVAFTARRARVTEDGETACDTASGGMCPECSFTDVIDTIEVRAVLADGLRRDDIVYELEPTAGSPILDRAAKRWAGTVGEVGGNPPTPEGPRLQYAPDTERHCVRLVARDLDDGSETVSDEHCPTVAEDEEHVDAGPGGPDAGDAGSTDTSSGRTDVFEGRDGSAGESGNLDWSSSGPSSGCGCAAPGGRRSPWSGAFWAAMLIVVSASVRLRRRY